MDFSGGCHFHHGHITCGEYGVVLNIFGSCFGNLFFGWWNSTRRWSWGWVWYSPREAQLQEADVTLWWFETVLYLLHWFIFILVPWSRQRCISIVKAVCLVETCVPLSSMSTRHFSVRGMSLPQRKKKKSRVCRVPSSLMSITSLHLYFFAAEEEILAGCLTSSNCSDIRSRNYLSVPWS